MHTDLQLERIVRALASGEPNVQELATQWVATERAKGQGQFFNVSFDVRFLGHDLLSETGEDALEDLTETIRRVLRDSYPNVEIVVTLGGSISMGLPAAALEGVGGNAH